VPVWFEQTWVAARAVPGTIAAMAAASASVRAPNISLARPRRFGGAGGPFMWVLPPLEDSPRLPQHEHGTFRPSTYRKHFEAGDSITVHADSVFRLHVHNKLMK
jgi:hypothetical protein